VLDPQGRELAQAELVVVAAGPGSLALARPALPLQPIRGQLSWAPAQPGEQCPDRP
jgi:tRNA 5-methylaminomethyl-2-thiouridine biosynthesis bifunctional protein